jgi:hypothetical protein
MKLEIPSSCSSLAVTRNTNRVDPEGGDDPLNQEVYDLLWLPLPDGLTRGRTRTILALVVLGGFQVYDNILELAYKPR